MKLLAVVAIGMVTVIGSSTASVILPFGPKRCDKLHAEARIGAGSELAGVFD